MMKYASPESRGISTASIKKYISHLERAGLSTHSLIIARGSDIVLERYWAPFNSDFLHRMYSVTKSFVAIAIGFLQDEGRISLDDPISVYFPTECSKNPDENVKKQRIRDMLAMSTALTPSAFGWFERKPADRVSDYFEPRGVASYPSGRVFKYDSTGSFVLGALVERVSGKSLGDYLNEKLFSKLGIQRFEFLTCPGGHAWSDSALLMRPLDLLKVARFMLNGGSWEGKQLISADYVREATSPQIYNSDYGFAGFDKYGYGYLIWRTSRNAYFFNGMGCQLAVCCPDKDMMLIYNGDNQGCDVAKSLIIDGFFTLVYDEAEDGPLPEYDGEPIENDFELFSVSGESHMPIAEDISGKTFIADKNSLGITEFSLTFGEEPSFRYVKGGKEMTLPFAMCKNVFSLFPEEGYSDKIGTVAAPGNRYKCAASAAWKNERQLLLRVQIIDKYFGNLGVLFSFEGEQATVVFSKIAEDFLRGYNGVLNAEIKDK